MARAEAVASSYMFLNDIVLVVAWHDLWTKSYVDVRTCAHRLLLVVMTGCFPYKTESFNDSNCIGYHVDVMVSQEQGKFFVESCVNCSFCFAQLMCV